MWHLPPADVEMTPHITSSNSWTHFSTLLDLYLEPKPYSANVKTGIFLASWGILNVRDFFGDVNIIFYGSLTFLYQWVEEIKTKCGRHPTLRWLQSNRELSVIVWLRSTLQIFLTLMAQLNVINQRLQLSNLLNRKENRLEQGIIKVWHNWEI